MTAGGDFAMELARYLNARWSVTQDVVADAPASLQPVWSAITQDLRQIPDEITPVSVDSVGLRVTAEHLVFLASRLIPALGAASGDLYTWTLSRETDEVFTIDHHRASAALEQMRRASDIWRSIDTTVAEPASVIDVALATGEVYVCALSALRLLLFESDAK